MKKALILALVAVAITGFSIYTIYNSDSSYSKTNSSLSTTSDKNGTAKTSDSGQTVKANPNNIKTKAMDFKLKDLDGNELSLSDLKGKKVFLNFWATWCPPCKAEMPEIEKLYQETKDSDLVIVSVEIGEPLDTVKSFIDRGL